MKKNYFKMMCVMVVIAITSFTSIKAQYTELYSDDFQSLAVGAHITDIQPAGTWIAANQPGFFFMSADKSGFDFGGWRGANLKGVEIENWAPDKNVRFTTELIITGDLKASAGNNKLFFGITERIPDGGNGVGTDKDTYTQNPPSIGLEIKNENSEELSFNLFGEADVFITDQLSVNDVIRITYTALKTTTSDNFNVSASIEKLGVNFTEGTQVLTADNVEQADIYGSSGTNLCFTAYSLLTFDAVWSKLILEIENSDVILPAADAGDDQTVIGNANVNLEGSSNYDDDTSVEYEWIAPQGITLSSNNTKGTSFTAPDVNRVMIYTFGFTVKAMVNEVEYESPVSEIEVVVNPKDGLYASGDGSQAMPYLISNNDHLYNLSMTPSDWKNNYFQMTASLDLSGDENFHPIGEGATFTGHFDGNDNMIKGLVVDVTGGLAGMFGEVVGGGTISNLGLIYPSITSTGTGAVGAIAAKFNDTDTRVYNCFVLGGSVIGKGPAGGLVGEIMNWGVDVISVENCFSSASVVGDWGAGGLVGGWNSGSVAMVGVEKSAFYGSSHTGSGELSQAIMRSHDLMTSAKVLISDCYYLAGSGIANSAAVSETEIADIDLNAQGSYPNLDFVSTWKISDDFGFAVLSGFDLTGISTGTIPTESLPTLTAYPNPVVDVLNIKDVAANATITVYSATGSVVKVIKSVGGLTQVDLSAQPTGVYIVKVDAQVIRVLKK